MLNNLQHEVHPALPEELRELVPPSLHEAVKAMQARDGTLPLLLFLVGHRPLAFVTGQFLYVVAPVAGLLGNFEISSWAALLSHPRGPWALEYLLQSQELNSRQDVTSSDTSTIRPSCPSIREE